jgi:hypothetical protein
MDLVEQSRLGRQRIAVDSWDKRTFLPEPVREYQILRSRFPANVWHLRIELTVMTAQNQAMTVFPSGTRGENATGWLTLDLK